MPGRDMAMGSVVLLVCTACVLAMGFAIQRGATCTVAAMDELVGQRRCTRLLALAEAAMVVTAGLMLAAWLRLGSAPVVGHALGPWTLFGAVLLGLGAYVNQACVFGAIARLGAGQWAYALTPLGFFAGCASMPWLFEPVPHASATSATAAPDLSMAWWVLSGGWLAWRLLHAARAWRRPAAPARQRVFLAWTPHMATLVIGACFCVMLLLAGAWAYTDVLAELAAGTDPGSARLNLRVAWLLALWLGALAGGWSAGLWRRVPVRPLQALRCLAGGMLMGWGSLLIPGSNDGLILVGLPLLQPHAWIAFATMCLTIGLALRAEQAWRGNRAARLVGSQQALIGGPGNSVHGSERAN